MKQLSIFLILIIITLSLFAQDKTNLKAGQTFKDCPTCPEMVVIPAGNFMMGSPENEPGHYPEVITCFLLIM